jgi:hypothetical protein
LYAFLSEDAEDLLRQALIYEVLQNFGNVIHYVLFKNPVFCNHRPHSQRLIWIPLGDFLRLVPKAKFFEGVLRELRERMMNRRPLDPMFLDIDKMGEVIGHEGRHRAFVAKELGISLVPVIFYCRNDEGDYLPYEEWDIDQLIPEKPFNFKIVLKSTLDSIFG